MEPEEQALALRLGASLRRARLQNRFTQAELAEKAGLSVNHLSCLETGDRLPSLPMLLRLASALGISVGSLLGEEQAGGTTWIAGFLSSLTAEARSALGSALGGPPPPALVELPKKRRVRRAEPSG